MNHLLHEYVKVELAERVINSDSKRLNSDITDSTPGAQHLSTNSASGSSNKSQPLAPLQRKSVEEQKENHQREQSYCPCYNHSRLHRKSLSAAPSTTAHLLPLLDLDDGLLEISHRL